jgi:hypothetical protein
MDISINSWIKIAKDETQYQVIKVENGVVWFKTQLGVGCTIPALVSEVSGSMVKKLRKNAKSN